MRRLLWKANLSNEKAFAGIIVIGPCTPRQTKRLRPTSNKWMLCRQETFHRHNHGRDLRSPPWLRAQNYPKNGWSSVPDPTILDAPSSKFPKFFLERSVVSPEARSIELRPLRVTLQVSQALTFERLPIVERQEKCLSKCPLWACLSFDPQFHLSRDPAAEKNKPFVSQDIQESFDLVAHYECLSTLLVLVMQQRDSWCVVRLPKDGVGPITKTFEQKHAACFVVFQNDRPQKSGSLLRCTTFNDGFFDLGPIHRTNGVGLCIRTRRHFFNFQICSEVDGVNHFLGHSGTVGKHLFGLPCLCRLTNDTSHHSWSGCQIRICPKHTGCCFVHDCDWSVGHENVFTGSYLVGSLCPGYLSLCGSSDTNHNILVDNFLAVSLGRRLEFLEPFFRHCCQPQCFEIDSLLIWFLKKRSLIFRCYNISYLSLLQIFSWLFKRNGFWLVALDRVGLLANGSVSVWSRFFKRIAHLWWNCMWEKTRKSLSANGANENFIGRGSIADLDACLEAPVCVVFGSELGHLQKTHQNDFDRPN